MNKLILLLLTGIWLGLVLGLSFIEAPLKFQAPGITTKLGLGIGKLVFGVLNKIEICLALVFMGLGFNLFKEMNLFLVGTIGFLIATVLVQSVFLLPALNERVALILSGQEVAPSKLHLIFIFLEIGKVISLFLIFIKTYRL